MSDDDKKNESQNDQKTEKKLFQKGGPGGPGRGKTKKHQELSEAIAVIKVLLQDDDADLTSSKALDPLGRVLLHGITSKDLKVRTDSAKLYFTWLTKRIEAEEREKNDSSATPEEVSRFTELLQLRRDTDIQDAEYTEEMSSFEED